MNSVPPEVHAHILSYCFDSPRSVFNFLFVTRQLPSLSERATTKIWDSLFYSALVHVFGGNPTPNDSSKTYWKLYTDTFSAYDRYKATMRKLVIANLSKASDEADSLSALSTQIFNFVEFVSHSHSWYKHMSLLEPYNDPFVFHLDPTSNMRQERDPGNQGGLRFIDFKEGDGTKFHYTWMTTDAYRSRFGFLSYGVFDLETDEAKRFRTIFWPDGSEVKMPSLNPNSAASCTSAIHSSTRGYYGSAFELAVNRVDLRDMSPDVVVGSNILARRHSCAGDGQSMPENAIRCIEAVVKVRAAERQTRIEPKISAAQFHGEIRELVHALFPSVQQSSTFEQNCCAFFEWFFPKYSENLAEQSNLCLIAQRIHEQSTMARACASCYVDIGLEGVDETFCAKLDSLVRCELFSRYVRSLPFEKVTKNSHLRKDFLAEVIHS